MQLYRLKTNPCPPEQIFLHAPLPRQTSYFDGGYLGIELAKTSARERKTETPVGSDDPTFRTTDSGDPIGFGILAGYNFRPSNGNFVVGPFASFDYLRQTINHNFAGGQFLGSTTNWFGNVGVKAGFVTAPGFYLYGLAGAAFVNHDLNVNFATAARSNVTTPGFTLGLGGEYRPTSWQVAGHPVTLFAQYQHTWWNNADFNRPASSPAFNYVFQRQDDTFRLGVNFYFAADASQPATSQKYPVKAPASK
jgi:opacity protein-like surface antigen